MVVQPELVPFIESWRGALDYLELVPDTAWSDLGKGATPRYVDDEGLLQWLERLGLPVVLHSIGMSIGSEHSFDRSHLQQIATWQHRLGAHWHSDHLAWHLAALDAAEVNVNLTLPVQLTFDMLDLISARIIEVQSTVGAPFLIENNVYYFDCGEPELDEATFLHELTTRTGCGLLLDLHNLWCNTRNRGWDAMAYLDRVGLDAVVEIHVAGESHLDGFVLDAHAGAVPDDVWELLDDVAPRCPNLRGVTFELFGSWFTRLGARGVRAQLERARGIVDRAKKQPA